MRILLFILLAAFVVVVLWVALANASSTALLSLGIGETREVSLAEVIVCGVVAGAFFTGFLAVVEGLSLRLENLRLRRRLRKLEEEIHDLRNIALGSEEPAGAPGEGGRPSGGPPVAADET